MNETSWILASIIAFAVGYAIAYVTKNLRELATRWGIFSILLFPLLAVFLVMGSAYLTELKSVIISGFLAIGFLTKLFGHKNG